MSKTNPNQGHYKTAGRAQSEGPDRMETNVGGDDKRTFSETEKNTKHPAVQSAKKK